MFQLENSRQQETDKASMLQKEVKEANNQVQVCCTCNLSGIYFAVDLYFICQLLGSVMIKHLSLLADLVSELA